jgi:regulator of replication initiation timing
MLRICLVLVIVVALGALGVSQNISTKLETTKQTLQTTRDELGATTTKLQTSLANEREARLQAEDLRTQLDTTEVALEETRARATQQQNRADELEVRLNDTTRSRNEFETQLSEWKTLGRTPQEVQQVLEENSRLTIDMAAMSQENLVLQRERRRLVERLSVYEGEILKVELPTGLRGRVLAVDPKFEFVVLDIGEQDGVLERGEMLVNRSGKLVARVRIMSVQTNRSVANVMLDWKQAEIMEGDVVTVGL